MRYETGDEITLQGMEFHACVGILPHEREHAQPLEIDLTVRTARGTKLLDYRRLYGHVRAALQSEPLDYLEDIANDVARRVLTEEAVLAARVAVRKPHVGLGGPLRHAEVAVTRGRGMDA